MESNLNKLMRETPHLTTQSINFLDNFFKEKPLCKVLEFGTGGTTVWFLRENRAGELHSLEHNKLWHDKVVKFLSDNKNTLTSNIILNIKYIPEPYDSYCDKIEDNYFDFILVDGYHKRSLCFQKSIRILKKVVF